MRTTANTPHIQSWTYEPNLRAVYLLVRRDHAVPPVRRYTSPVRQCTHRERQNTALFDSMDGAQLVGQRHDHRLAEQDDRLKLRAIAPGSPRYNRPHAWDPSQHPEPPPCLTASSSPPSAAAAWAVVT